jgi:hypothetical protein
VIVDSPAECLLPADRAEEAVTVAAPVSTSASTVPKCRGRVDANAGDERPNGPPPQRAGPRQDGGAWWGVPPKLRSASLPRLRASHLEATP